MQNVLELSSPVTALAGVGEKRAAQLAGIGITDLKSLLNHFPRGYQNRGNVIRVCDAKDGEVVSLILTITVKPGYASIGKGRTITHMVGSDSTGKCNINFFNYRYAEQTFTLGSTFRFFGKVEIRLGRPSLTGPIFERVTEGGKPLRNIVPVYPLTSGISQKQMGDFVAGAFRALGAKAYIPLLPDEVAMKQGLCTPYQAWNGIHNPSCEEDIKRATAYFAYAELFKLGLRNARSKQGVSGGLAMPIAVSDAKLRELTSRLPYSLTGCQDRAIGEIRADMLSGKPMNRILCGDVGSGKTIVAASAAFVALANGCQAALMSPTEILARQHYAQLSALFEPMGISCGLLVGSLSAGEKKRMHKEIAEGKIKFVVGTHALISEGVKFSCCPLVITDEQHRFGVGQRETLCEKGRISLVDESNERIKGRIVSPHNLIMSATPIPRSLAMVIYGSLDRSILDELPPGRQKVDTFVVNSSYMERLDAFILKRTAEGERCYIVCPAVSANEEGECSDSESLVQFTPSGNGTMNFSSNNNSEGESGIILKNAVDEAARLSEIEGLKVGCVHGKMKSAEKDKVMADFASGEINVLVSTTVIEVGVNVPEATLMIVLNAERFGLSQLHQLRGRVGRGNAKSWCVLVSDSTTSEAKERLNVLHCSDNGFEIAEYDLKQRGPGDFLAMGSSSNEIRQSGEPGLVFAVGAVGADNSLLEKAFADAKKYAESDWDTE